MPVRGQAFELHFFAWDNDNNVGKVNDSANFTLKLRKDNGTAFSPAGTIMEPDSTNLKGHYSFTVASGEGDCRCLAFGGLSSTGTGIIILPQFISMETQTERFGAQAKLDTATAVLPFTNGIQGTLNDVSTNVTALTAKFDGRVGGTFTFTGTDVRSTMPLTSITTPLAGVQGTLNDVSTNVTALTTSFNTRVSGTFAWSGTNVKSDMEKVNGSTTNDGVGWSSYFEKSLSSIAGTVARTQNTYVYKKQDGSGTAFKVVAGTDVKTVS